MALPISVAGLARSIFTRSGRLEALAAKDKNGLSFLRPALSLHLGWREPALVELTTEQDVKLLAGKFPSALHSWT